MSETVGRFRDIRGLGTTVAVLLGVLAVLQLPNIVFSWQSLGELEDSLDRGRTGLVGVGSAEAELAVAGALVLVALGITVVLLVWVRRARVNAGALSPGYPFRFTPQFAVGGMLVPLANFWWSRAILGEIWSASRPGRGGGRNALMLAWWWTVVVDLVFQVLAVTTFDRFSTVVLDPRTGRVVEGAEQAWSSFRNAALAGTVDGLLTAASTILLALFVLQVTRLQSDAVVPADRDQVG